MARKLASLKIEFDLSIYSQHIKGSKHLIADMLSRDFHLTDLQLTSLFTHLFPEQIHLGLKIVPLPKEIILWIYSLQDCLPVAKASPQVHIHSSLGALIDGASSKMTRELVMNSLMDSSILKNPEFSQLSAKVLDEMKMVKESWTSWREIQSKPPLKMCV